jgi:hypothetical protein
MLQSTSKPGLFEGGPTSWDARIIKGDESYREFALEFQDLALAYTSASIGQRVCYPGTKATPDCKEYSGLYPPITPTTPNPPIIATTPVFGWADRAHAINPSATSPPPPPLKPLKTTPTIISGSAFNGTMTVNYRNEPIALRVDKRIQSTPPDPPPPPDVHDPNDPMTDLAFAFASMKRYRSDLNLNRQPAAKERISPANDFKFNAPYEGAGDFDPYTPLLRAYQGDNIQVRVLVGGYLFNHNFSFHGVKWLSEPSSLNSGYRDNQAMGISEHFEFLFKAPVTQKVISREPCMKSADPKIFCADYLYTPGSGQWDLAQGLWGLMRTYNTGDGTPIAGLKTLPNNSRGGAGMAPVACPAGANQRNYYVKAINDRPLTYADRISTGNAIINPYPLRWILTDKQGAPLSTDKTPLVLRANAGDCVNVTLTNEMSTAATGNIFKTRDKNIPGFAPLGVNSTSGFYASIQAGMHPQLLTYDVTSDGGMNVGLNPTQTVAPGSSRTYRWYAGNIDGTTATPVEFGSSNIISADPIEHPSLSMVGAFITEPKGSTWPANGPLMADVMSGSTVLFREFVNVLQNNVYLYGINALPPNNTAKFFNSINYWTNSMAYRFGGQNGINTNLNPNNNSTLSDAFSNTHQVPLLAAGTEWGDPRPVWIAERKKAFRMRWVHPDGLGGFPDDVI